MSNQDEILFQGTTICPGIGIGVVIKLEEINEVQRINLRLDQIKDELNRYTDAVHRAQKRLHEHVEGMHENPYLSTSQILTIHELILNDKQFHDAVLQRISKDSINAEWALLDETRRILSGLTKSGDSYFTARSEDILDMTRYLITALSPHSDVMIEENLRLKAGQVIVTSNLFVSEVLKAHRYGVRGVATESNALTSHAAILLRSHNIPSVGVIDGMLGHAKQGDRIIVDGLKGMVILRPRTEIIKKYHALMEKQKKRGGKLLTPPIVTNTADGTPIHLFANVDHYNQIKYVISNRLEGIGLFRTEFLAVADERIPDEEEQYSIYKRTIDESGGRRVIFRTFDLGADKLANPLEQCTGSNPALGMRGIRRHLFLHPEELYVQLRALLRAGQGTTIDILIPLVTKVDELVQVKGKLERIKKELAVEKKEAAYRVRLGAMIEVPAAAFAIQEILPQVDFVNIGTNDLIQYFMAADRDNEAVMNYYGDLYNSSFLSLLQFIIERAMKMKRENDIAICGEIASNQACVPLLIGMGYRSLSISPILAQTIRDVIVSLNLTEMKEIDSLPKGESYC